MDAVRDMRRTTPVKAIMPPRSEGVAFLPTAAGVGSPSARRVRVCRTPRAPCKRRDVRMMAFVDPWSVTTEQVATQLFAASLFPYLGFLWHIGKKETNCPPLALNGFKFLLAFVAGTIPAGIYAKTAYHTILANVDWLHGGAESLLTITNLLILAGFKQAQLDAADTETKPDRAGLLTWVAVGVGISAALAGLPALVPAGHLQPANALSVPTWVIHISSLIEWLVAMDLIWERARLTGNERWKGLTWGMIPLHTSGLLACTYHMFYNAPSLDAMVAMQAGLTLAGNATMWLGAYRIYKAELERAADDESTPAERARGTGGELTGNTDLTTSLVQVTVISVVASVFLRLETLYFDFPFNPILPAAMAFVVLPSLLNVGKWVSRSQAQEAV